MTEHRELPVSGYRPQTEHNVKIVNNNKELEEIILRVFDTMKNDPAIDQRWLAVGRTHIEEGFMAVNRAVFKPERVKITSDTIVEDIILMKDD